MIHSGSPCRSFFYRATKILTVLKADKSGVISFEYIIVALCIVTVVILAFGTNTSTGLGKSLADALAAVVAKLP